MAAAPITIVNAGCRSTNYWVVSAGRSRVLVDLGWPGTMGTMRAQLERMGVPLGEIRLDDGAAFTGDLTWPRMIGAVRPMP